MIAVSRYNDSKHDKICPPFLHEELLYLENNKQMDENSEGSQVVFNSWMPSLNYQRICNKDYLIVKVKIR